MAEMTTPQSRALELIVRDILRGDDDDSELIRVTIEVKPEESGDPLPDWQVWTLVIADDDEHTAVTTVDHNGDITETLEVN
jgi:hypothetical protein